MAQNNTPAKSDRAPEPGPQTPAPAEVGATLLADSNPPASPEPAKREFQFPGHSHGDEEHEGDHVGWNTSIHGDIKLQLNHQNSARGGSSVDSVNWLSVGAERELAGGDFEVRGTLSLEPWTAAGGTRQLFQTGGVHRDRPIIDAQHPHNFLSELSVNYSRPIAQDSRLLFSGGIGAPALGPIYFHEHDLTLGTDLSHHFLEGTHNSNGFATIGVQHGKFQVEASAFHGRESADPRKITIGSLDSTSVRVAFAPTENIVLQASHGNIKSPEILEPGDVERTTVSAAHQMKWSDGSLQSLVAFGRNNEQHGTTEAIRAESILRFRSKNALFARYEHVQKHGLLEGTKNEGEAGGEERAFPIQAFTIGATRDLVTTDSYKAAIGANLTLHKIPQELKPVYGNNPVAARVFMRVTF